MKKTIVSLLAAFVLIACQNTSLPREKGSQAMNEALEAYIQEGIEKCHDFNSILVVRHGKVVAEAYLNGWTKDMIHEMWSTTKTFTAMAVGIAVEEGYLSLDTRFVDLFPEELSAVLDTLQDPVHRKRVEDATIADYLCMGAGHSTDVMGYICEKYGLPMSIDGFGPMIDYYLGKAGANLISEIFAVPFTCDPGAEFHYDNECSHMLSCAVQKATGIKESEYLNERLFKPLGIKLQHWDEVQGYTCGGWGLSITPEDMAKFGLCLLNEGKYNGKQIIPSEWVKSARTPVFTWEPYWWIGKDEQPSSAIGYGYQTWVGENFFRMQGAYGQFIYIIPEYDAVIVGTAEMGRDLDHEETYAMYKHFVKLFEEEDK